MERIDCFIPCGDAATEGNLLDQEPVSNVYKLESQSIKSTAAMREIAARTSSEYTLVYTKPHRLDWVRHGLKRMVDIASDTGAAMAYADHFNVIGDVRTEAPVIDCQMGALRDDFDFGSVMLFKTSVLKAAVAGMNREYLYAGLYDLRLRVQRLGSLEHINEYLYYEVETDTRKSGEKLFDYVDPKNRDVQIEMEEACTDHLKAVGGYLEPVFKEIDLETTASEFEYEASVVIPCKNRVRTIGDAIRSALSQKTTFKYNVFVVDDNSTDGTVEIIKQFENDRRLIYIAQDKSYHAIGGNWNAALHHPKCGRFAIQLDSDDVYYDETTVQKFVEAFSEQKCAMIVGTYRMTNFDLETIPPGIIEHREWTPENGRNNALRINGLGAPRGFYVPLLRTINFPTTKYGEDYAV
ncbi:MAG: glycosyltransferase family 2 protein, partial [Bacteroidales bacterium]|nr:glycosyltransferase family 2 protein [Bacteroidales bacterium]